MSIFAKKPNQGRDFEPCPDGFHRLVCCDVWMEADVVTKFGKKDMLFLLFQADPATAGLKKYVTKEGEDREGLYTVIKRDSLSVHPKANLRKTIETWRGRKFKDDDEAAAFDFEKLVGQNCQAQVQHSEPTAEGKVYANITAIVQAHPGLPALTVEGYVRKKDRDGGSGGQQEEDDLPF